MPTHNVSTIIKHIINETIAKKIPLEDIEKIRSPINVDDDNIRMYKNDAELLKMDVGTYIYLDDLLFGNNIISKIYIRRVYDFTNEIEALSNDQTVGNFLDIMYKKYGHRKTLCLDRIEITNDDDIVIYVSF